MSSFTVDGEDLIVEPVEYMGATMFKNFLKKTIVGKAIRKVAAPAVGIAAGFLPGGSAIAAGIASAVKQPSVKVPSVPQPKVSATMLTQADTSAYQGGADQKKGPPTTLIIAGAGAAVLILVVAMMKKK